MRSALRDAFAAIATDRRHRHAMFIPAFGRTTTFGELADDVTAVERALADRLPEAPCLVAHVGNHAGFVPLLLGALERGAAIALLDGDAPDAAADDVARALGADAVVSPLPASPGGAGGNVTPLAIGLGWRGGHDQSKSTWRSRFPAEPLVLKLTSGSTSRARAVVASEVNLLADVRQVCEAMEIRPEDVNLAAIPLSHSYGLGNLVLPLVVQGTPLVLRDGFAPKDLPADLTTFGVTTLPVVPYVFEHLLRGNLLESLRPVRRLISAGAPLSRGLLDAVYRACGHRVHSFYGTSETGGISYDPSDDIRDPLTVGRPLPGVTIALCDDDREREPRVFVRSPAVSLGYASGTDEGDGAVDAPAFVDGGFLTGDVGRLDASGRLSLVGRVSAFINVGGRKVDPAEVEGVLRSMPGISDVVVVGVPCDRRGECVAAAVRAPSADVTVAEVRRFCAGRLAPYKVPRDIVMVDEWPIDARGKVDRRAVAAMIGATAGGGDPRGATIMPTMAGGERDRA